MTLYYVRIHTSGVAGSVLKVLAACKAAGLKPENKLEEADGRVGIRVLASDWHTSLPKFRAALVAQSLPGSWDEPALIAHGYKG